MNNGRKHLIITEREQSTPHHPHRVARARRYLYEVIAQFRKDARDSDDYQTQNLFDFAADIITVLVRVFRRYDEDENSHRSVDQ
jgi:hypothetical protein